MKTLALILLTLFASAAAAQPACNATLTSACLSGDRFQVEMSFDTSGASFVAPDAGTPSGSAQVVNQSGFPSDSTAAFSFYDAGQVDAFVKVLNGCPITNHYWVFSAGATDAATTITVTDTATGDVVQYANPAGQAFVPITDTNAFQTCDAGTASAGVVPVPPGTRGTCGAAFCLQGGRYALDVAYTDNGSINGDVASSLATDRSGLGFLFDDQSPELVSTVIDGRAGNNAFWFLTSTSTNLELTYSLTDTTTSLTNVYVDSQGPGQTLLDRGQPVSASISGPPAAVSPGLSATYTLTLTNTAPIQRFFTATIPTPAGASNPAFTCTAFNGAVCPNASGSGPFAEGGALAPGGEIVYDYTVTVGPARGAAAPLVAEATVITAAHALAGEGRIVISAGATMSEAVPVPVDAGWLLVLLFFGLLATAVRCRP